MADFHPLSRPQTPPLVWLLWGSNRRQDGGCSAAERASVRSGCGSVAFVLNSWMFLFFCLGRVQRWSEPQTEEHDEVTHMKGCRAAVSWWIGVPRKLNQSQDQDSAQQETNIFFMWMNSLGGVPRFRNKMQVRNPSTWAGEPVSSHLHSRAGKAVCGSTTRRTGSATSGWSTCLWS